VDIFNHDNKIENLNLITLHTVLATIATIVFLLDLPIASLVFGIVPHIISLVIGGCVVYILFLGTFVLTIIIKSNFIIHHYSLIF